MALRAQWFRKLFLVRERKGVLVTVCTGCFAVVESFEGVMTFKTVIRHSGMQGGEKEREQYGNDDVHNTDRSRRTEFCKQDCTPPIASRAACASAG